VPFCRLTASDSESLTAMCASELSLSRMV